MVIQYFSFHRRLPLREFAKAFATTSYTSPSLSSKTKWKPKLYPTSPSFFAFSFPSRDVVGTVTTPQKYISLTSSRALSTTTNISSKTIDTLIIGGGPIGLSTAYHLATHHRNNDGSSITIVERDPTYSRASAVLSAGGIRQQFSLGENVQMSLYGRDFLRDAGRFLKVDEEEVDVQFQEHGYLFLASCSKGKAQMIKNHEVQRSVGCEDIHLLTPDQLREQFPWLNTEDVVLGSYGAKGEGWFDPWALIRGLKRKCQSLGVNFVKGYPVGSVREFGENVGNIGHGKGSVTSVDVFHDDDDQNLVRYNVNYVVNAAGAHCMNLMETLAGKNADGSSNLHYTIPVEPRKRCIFFFHCATNQEPDIVIPTIAPLTVCPISKVYFRSEGTVSKEAPTGNFLCGVSPTGENDRAIGDLSDIDYADHELWEEVLWPALYHRVPAFGEVKVKSSWAGLYEYNTIDQNGIIDFHPDIPNCLLVNGFSGHGLQQSPAAGRAAAELLDKHKFATLNLDIFSFDRCRADGGKPPVFEAGIV